MLKLSYHRDTYRPGPDVIPGNDRADNPVEFDLVPAEGADLARIKSILVATSGLTSDVTWSPEMQAAVIAAFESGATCYVNTITAIRGLTVPAVMAVRVGIITADQVPVHQPAGATAPVANLDAPIAILNGFAFSRICGFSEVLVLAMMVAAELVKLSNRTTVDPRFFAQPSGSLPTGTPGQGADSTATPAPSAPASSGTAAGPGPKASRRRGTSQSKKS